MNCDGIIVLTGLDDIEVFYSVFGEDCTKGISHLFFTIIFLVCLIKPNKVRVFNICYTGGIMVVGGGGQGCIGWPLGGK